MLIIRNLNLNGVQSRTYLKKIVFLKRVKTDQVGDNSRLLQFTKCSIFKTGQEKKVEKCQKYPKASKPRRNTWGILFFFFFLL